MARYCSGFLATADDDFTRASMADALASYCLWIGDPESALKLWREAPAEPVFQRQRFCGIVKAHLLQALEAAKAGLVTLAGQNGPIPVARFGCQVTPQLQSVTQNAS